MTRYGIRLPDGVLVTDPEWRSVGDVMRSGHGHGITRVKGDLVELDDDGVPVAGQDLLTAFHTCEGHPDGHVGSFVPVSRTRLGCGCQRYRVRRCDGSGMELLDGACARHDDDLTTSEESA